LVIYVIQVFPSQNQRICLGHKYDAYLDYRSYMMLFSTSCWIWPRSYTNLDLDTCNGKSYQSNVWL